MIFMLTHKDCQISDSSYDYINAHLEKLERYLPSVKEDEIVLRMFIRRNVDRYHPPRTHLSAQRTYARKKPALANFEGSINFRFNKKRLYVHFKGQTIDECADTGFGLIFKELDKYKDTHFSSESEYPDHSTIRGT